MKFINNIMKKNLEKIINKRSLSVNSDNANFIFVTTTKRIKPTTASVYRLFKKMLTENQN